MTITAEQLDKIHALQRVAMHQGNLATMWALSLAVTFALDIPQQVDADIARVSANLRSKP
jgi:hypothetical protein